MQSRWRRLGRASVVALTLALATQDTRADEPAPSEAARAAYDRGTRAYDRGDYAVAAGEFALADALAPHPVALKWALSAAVRADDPVLGMTLVARADRGPTDAPLASAVAAARQKFERRVGAITVVCPRGVACEARVDGAATRPSMRTYVTPGSHLVEISVQGRIERRWATVDGGAGSEVVGTSPAPLAAPETPAAPPSAAAPTRDPSSPRAPAPRPTSIPDAGADGIAPIWFWLGAGVTAVFGGITIASGVDTLAKHDAYLETREPGGDAAGRSAETRTNVLLGTTAIVGLATGLVGLFAVRWSSVPARQGSRSAGVGVAF